MDNPTTKNGSQIPSTAIQLVITLDRATGAVNVTGPVGDLLFCYGLLEAAKDSVREFVKQQAAGSKIVPVSAMPNLRM